MFKQISVIVRNKTPFSYMRLKKPLKHPFSSVEFLKNFYFIYSLTNKEELRLYWIFIGVGIIIVFRNMLLCLRWF